jgi:putative transposase
MILQRTAKIRLISHSDPFRSSINTYTKAFNYIARIGWDHGVADRKTLHHMVYHDVRTNFGLPSQLAISAITKAIEAIKSAKARLKTGKKASCPQSKHCSLRLDANSYSLWLNKSKASILTVDGRLKVDILIPEHFRQYLSWEYASADLIVVGNKAHLHVVFQKEVENTESHGEVVGIDRGIKKLAVTSKNQFFGGGLIKNISQKYVILRSQLQSRGSRSAKRHLAKIARKEQRFRRDINHVVSKKIVDSLKPGDTIALENLTGIRDRCNFAKKMRTQVHKWNFFQLQQFLGYKAAAKGISVVTVDPRYTSQCCSSCGCIDKRSRKDQARFECVSCGFRLNADLNASRNIANKHRVATSCTDGADLSTSLSFPALSR